MQPSPGPSASFDLRRTVTVNESLKQVVGLAREINLVAINASLIARRVGRQAEGFHVLAIELRAFSAKMGSMVDNLGSLVFKMVRHNATLSKARRRLVLLRRSARPGAPGARALAAKLAEQEAGYRKGCWAAEADCDALCKEIHHSLLLCRTSAMLSHNCRIEASYGGTMLADMQNISHRIDEIMEQTVHELKQLNATMAAEQ